MFGLTLYTQNAASPDFATGVSSLLELKIEDARYDWSPSEVKDVVLDDVRTAFFPQGDVTSAAELNSAAHAAEDFLDFTEDEGSHSLRVAVSENVSEPAPFMRWSLPSEYYVEAIVKSQDKTTPEALVDSVVKTFRGKLGTREKVVEILSRRSE